MMIFFLRNSIFFIFLFVFSKSYSQLEFQIKANGTTCSKCVCNLIKNDSIIATKILDVKGQIIFNNTEIEKTEKLRLRMFNNYFYVYNFQEQIMFNESGVINAQNITSEVNLDEVIIVGVKKKIIDDQGDKIIYNVSEDDIGNALNASDVLKRAPLISIGSNGSPSIRGGSDTTILINGKPISGLSSTQILSQIPSTDIISVEVITAPSVKYGASGSSGIINIITKKKINLKTAGNLGAGLGSRGSHLYLNYHYQLNDFSSLSSSFSTLIYYPKLASSYSLNDIDGTSLNKVTAEGDNKGALYYYSVNYSKGNDNGDAFDLYFNYYSSTDKTIQNGLDNDLNNLNSDTNVSYDYFQLKADKVLNVENFGILDLSVSTAYLPVKNSLEFSTQNIENSSSVFNLNFSTNLDFRLNRKFKGSIGSEISVDDSDGDNKFVQGANSIQNDFSQRRFLSSAYIELNYKLNNTSKFKFGVRNEGYSIYNNLSLLQEINSFFYTLSYTKKISSKKTFSINFFKRIERPTLNNLLPITNNSSFILSNIGNPNLELGLSYTLDLGISNYFGSSFLKISPFVTITDKKISRFLVNPEGANLVVSTPINLDKSINYGVTTWLTTKLINKKMSLNCGLDIISKQLEYERLKNNGIQLLAKINTSFEINKHFDINFFGSFASKDFFIQGSRNPYTYSNFSIKNNFSEDLTFSLSVDNPFRNGYNAIEDFNTGNADYSSNQLFFDRGIRLIATFKFGASDKLEKLEKDNMKKNNILDN